MPGDVLTALDEELGRVGSQAHLDSLPVGLLDDLEDGPLVVVRLGEDHLVGPYVDEHARELFSAAEAPEAGNPVLGDDPDELVGEPAPGCRKGVPQVDQALALADEHDPAPDACGAHHLERDGLVRRSEEADRQRGREDGRRDEPGSREVVARPEPEREDDQCDDDQRREDATGSGPALALPVEARLREHEDGDRRGELEPLRRPLAPEQPPEDVAVAADELAHDEREVDPEREPGDVEGDEREDRERPPDERSGSARGRGRRHGRRGRRALRAPEPGQDERSRPGERPWTRQEA